jgi:geranylgeranyl reductase family protein
MNHDVIVVGAGPSGSTCAKNLAEKGINVVIIDKYEFPRHKTCAGGLLQHTFREFEYIKPYIEQYNSTLTVYDADLLNSFTISSEQPMVAMTSGRKHFDNELLMLAKNAGAEFIGGKIVKKIQYIHDGIEVIMNDGTTKTAKMVVGADSLPSVVASSLHFGLTPAAEGKDIYGVAFEKEFILGESVCDNYFGQTRTVSLFLHYQDVEGYAWIFPRKSSVNIGLGGSAKHSKRIGQAFQILLDQLIHKNIIPEHDIEGKKIDASQKIGAILPVIVPNQSIFTDRAVLVGDAGGFCSAATGEGIYYAMKSGLEAANTIYEILIKDPHTKFNKKTLSHYYTRIKDTLIKELKFQYFALEKVIKDGRRSRKAVAWGAQDEKLRELLGQFLVGARSYNHIQLTMLYHYVRCKFKEKLGILKKPPNVDH